MRHGTTRRKLLKGVGGVLIGMGGGIPRAAATAAEEVAVTPDLVEFSPELEPLVRLIEDTPRERIIERIADRLRGGLSTRQLVAALFLAAIRSGTPHEVFAVHSAYQMSLDAPVADRLFPLFPLFWTLYSQAGSRVNRTAADLEAKGMRPLRGAFPSATTALADFQTAIVAEDLDKAERAFITVARVQGTHTLGDLLWAYGARSAADLYHIPIGVANAWRTLETIGHQHAEPVLRWLVRSLHGPGDSHYRSNQERMARECQMLPPAWAGGAPNPNFTGELLGLIRGFETENACDFAAKSLAAGKVQAGAVWDAVHLAAGELLMCKPNVGHPLHSNTSANALRYGFRMTNVPETRLLILLQAVAWQCRARWRLDDLAKTDPQWKLRALRIVDLKAEPGPGRPEEAVREVLDAIAQQPDRAAARLFQLAQHPAQRTAFVQAAQHQAATKGQDIHDLKYPAAVFEDCQLVSPQWGPHLMASSAYWLPATVRADAPAAVQAREVLRTRLRGD